MPIRPCPVCAALGPRQLDHNISPMRWFYRCGVCDHVWSVKKSDPDGPITDVTPRPKG